MRIFIALTIALALINLSCRSVSNPAPNLSAATTFQAPTPKHITPADLAQLRWIEGSWRGTGDIDKPFFERYHFENESTLVMESLSDETLSKVGEVTRYELKDGQFSDGHYVATAIDDSSITFAPLAKGLSPFRWQRESKDSWKAILTVPASGGAAAGQRTYLLERWPKKSN